MLDKIELGKQIDILIDYLAHLQNENGSFEGKFLFSAQPEKGWLSWGDLPYDTASIILSLHTIESVTAKQIINKSCKYLLSENLDNKAWRFSSSQGYDPLLFDIDSTAISSFALELYGNKIENKSFLNYFIDKKNNYKTWLVPSYPSFKIPFPTYIKLFWESKRAIRLNKFNISISDWEFSINCNVLLHVNKSNDNKHVWEKLISDFKKNDIECRYYNKYYAIYAYARLYAYSKYDELYVSEKLMLSYINELTEQLAETNFSLNHVFLANTIMLFKLDRTNYQQVFETCSNHVFSEKYKIPAAYYSSNLIYDKNPDNDEPVIYFGSEGLTCSLYIEFIVLYNQ